MAYAVSFDKSRVRVVVQMRLPSKRYPVTVWSVGEVSSDGDIGKLRIETIGPDQGLISEAERNAIWRKLKGEKARAQANIKAGYHNAL